MLVSSKPQVWRGAAAALVLASACGAPSGAAASAAAETHVGAGYGKIPLSFEANRGQTDPQVRFLARGEGYALFLTGDQAVIELKPSQSGTVPGMEPASVLRMNLVGANGHAPSSGEKPQTGVTNYLIGNDPKLWHSDIKAYSRVKYRGVYPGVDLVYYGNQRQLEYDFIVAPGADPAKIALGFDGARPSVDDHGDLVLPVNGDEVRFHKPVVYQMMGGQRKAVAASYRVANNETHFQVGAYDHRKALIIDPVLSYLTYLGGGDADYIGNNGAQQTYGTFQGQGIAVDNQGSAYVAGTTYSVNFPTQAPYQAAGRESAGSSTGFVTKLNPAGTAFVYSTFLGGTVRDSIRAIAVDGAGSAYVVGRTQSADFPVTSAAFQTMCAPDWTGTTKITSCGGSGNANSFVTKLSADGASLVYSTFLGGNNRGGGDGATAVAVDSKGQAYVTGVSGDYCHPGNAIAYFGNGNYTYEQPYYCFPTTTGAFVPGTENDTGSGNVPYNGGTPATVAAKYELQTGYLTVFSADGSSLLYSTLLSHPIQGGSGFYGTEIAVDSTGNIYVAGTTSSGNLSTTAGAFQTTTGMVAGGQTPPLANLSESRGFVAKFGPVSASAPASLLYLTYLGGSTNQSDLIGGIVADSAGNAYVSGSTREPDFPVTAGSYQTACNTDISNPTNCHASFVTKIKPDGSGLVWSTYLGSLTSGTQVSFGGPIALDAKGNVYVVGTSDNAFPQVNPIQTNSGGNSQAFLAELDPTGSTLLFSTLVGSGGTVGSQESAGLALDPAGNIYLAGYTNTASSLPVTAGAAQGAYGGGAADGFIAKIVRFAAAGTTLSVSSASVVSGTPVTLTAVVAGPSGSSAPTGTVSFQNAGTAVGSATLNGTGTATTTVTLATGSNVLTAVYSGDNTFATSTSAPQTVTVTAPVPTVTISSSPSSVVLGTAASLTWSSTGATACTAGGSWSGAEATSGTASVTPTAAGTASYTLTCTGAGGSATGTASLTVTAPPAPTVAIAVSPATITVGASTVITWSSTGATACAASGSWTGAEATSGTSKVTPTAAGTATYTLACTGQGGTTSKSATLTVNAVSHHGGGAMNPLALLVLVLLAGVRGLRGRQAA